MKKIIFCIILIFIGIPYISWGELNQIPDIKISVQSGLDYLGNNNYKCKKLKCRVNLTAEKTPWYDSKKYSCIWYFSGWTFKTKKTDKKCNPGYVSYWAWKFEIKLKFFSKTNKNNFQEKSIFFTNSPDIKKLFNKKSKIINTKVYVVKVIDWDTIVVRFPDNREEKVRFIWINAPEIKHFNQKSNEYFWQEAYRFVESKLEWKYIILQQNMDNYKWVFGRLLGYIYVDWKLFNKYLVDGGYVKVYLKYPFKYSSDFQKAQNYAIKNQLWMWKIKKGVITPVKEVITPTIKHIKSSIIKLYPPKTTMNFMALYILLLLLFFLMLFLFLRKNDMI